MKLMKSKQDSNISEDILTFYFEEMKKDESIFKDLESKGQFQLSRQIIKENEKKELWRFQQRNKKKMRKEGLTE